MERSSSRTAGLTTTLRTAVQLPTTKAGTSITAHHVRGLASAQRTLLVVFCSILIGLETCPVLSILWSPRTRVMKRLPVPAKTATKRSTS